MAKPFRRAELLERIQHFTGVRYVYAEPAPLDVTSASPPAPMTRERLAVIPLELRQQLQAAVIRGRRQIITPLIQQVVVIDPEVGGQLRNLVAAFDYATVIRLLNQEPS